MAGGDHLHPAVAGKPLRCLERDGRTALYGCGGELGGVPGNPVIGNSIVANDARRFGCLTNPIRRCRLHVHHHAGAVGVGVAGELG